MQPYCKITWPRAGRGAFALLRSLSLMLALGLAAAPAQAAQVFETGHFDLLINYEPDGPGWSARVWNHENNTFLAPDQAILKAGEASRQTIPAGEPWSIIGPAGEPVWVLPEVFDPQRVYLGIGTQLMQRGIFTGGYSNRGRISMRLIAISGSGPDAGGTFTMWQAGFPPRIHFSTGDGIGPEDALEDIPAGAHAHYNWAFSSEGDYIVTFEISGQLRPEYGGGYTSTEATYYFRVGSQTPPSILDNTVAMGGGWLWSPWLGFIMAESVPWAYFEEQGWWYLSEDQTAATANVWDTRLGWLYIDEDTWPYLYQYDQAAWLFATPAQDGLRWFYNNNTGEWFSEPLS